MATPNSFIGAPLPATQGAQGGALVVLLAGMITTALTLLGVYWLDNNTTGFHIMGWYGNYVIPAGALLVGLAAGSGYGIASYVTGLKIRRGLLLAVLALQLGGYVAAQYLEFRSFTQDKVLVNDDGQELTFARYYHLKAMNFAWDNHGQPGKPLGEWGYFFLGLGVLGFALGGVIAPALLIKVSYCERCQRYMTSRTLALVPASAPKRRVSKKDALAMAALAEDNDRALRAAGDTLERVTALAARNDGIAIRTALAPFPPKGPDAQKTDKLATRMRLSLVQCRSCASGHLQPEMVTGQGREIKVRALPRVPLSPDAAQIVGGE